MRKDVFKASLAILFTLVLGLSMAAVLADEQSDTSSSDFSFQVVRITNKIGPREIGKLTFMADKVLYEVTEGKGEPQTFNYDNLRTIEFKGSRLLKFKSSRGEEYKFTPVGAQTFDRDLMNFVRNTAGTSVKIKG